MITRQSVSMCNLFKRIDQILVHRSLFVIGAVSLFFFRHLSLKYLSVIPRLLMKKGWFLEVESQLGKSFKVSG